MTAMFYTGKLDVKGRPLDQLPEPVFDRFKNPDEYRPRDELISAANVALMLGQPLLLTGDPGVGKSRFASHFATALGLGEPLEFFVKSTTTARDLLYSFDELRRFRDPEPQPLQTYLSFNALGKAILFSGGPDRKLTQMPGLAFSPLKDQALPTHFRDLYPETEFPKERRKVVLIDEFDKAPRDTPNDLLNEIERMKFNIPELGLTVAAPKDCRPIIVITSNSERNFPDAFLRRCVYYDIPFPSPKDVRRIVYGQLKLSDEKDETGKKTVSRDFLDSAIAFFFGLREEASMTRSPGTSELLAWLSLLIDDAAIEKAQKLDTKTEAVQQTLSALAKINDDRTAALQYASGWSAPAAAPDDA